MSEPASPNHPLRGSRVLIVEDQYLIADEMRRLVVELGGAVIGPAGEVATILALIAAETPDLAVLDINLNGEQVWAVAYELRDRGVPLIFATGYDVSALRPPFEAAVHMEKPVSTRALAEAVERLGLASSREVLS
ncbi:MAG TPA: response regulator [Caulobacteraceae bacterium]|jgi:two-component SAPR family response regulator|nr:response regulator [Caulobacteraceae bacterium]